MGALLIGAGRTTPCVLGNFANLSSGGISSFATESLIKHKWPAGTFSKMGVSIDANGTGRSIALRKNSANGNSVISFTDSTAQIVYDTTHTDTIVDDDTIDIQFNGSGTAFSPEFVKVIFTAASGHGAVYGGGSNAAVGTTSTSYFSFGENQVTINTSEADSKPVFRAAGTISRLTALVATASTSTATLVSRINGATGNSTVSITLNVTGEFQDTTHSDTVAAGDTAAVQLSGQSTGIVLVWGARIAWSGNKNEVFGSMGGISVWDFTNVSFFGCIVSGQNNSWHPTEGETKLQHGFDGTATNLRIYLNPNTLNTSNNHLRIRKNGANGNNVVTVAATTTGWFEDTTHSDTFLANDDINLAFDTSSASGNASIWQIILTEWPVTAWDGQASVGGAGTLSTPLRQNMRISATLPGASTESVYANLRPMLAAGTFPGAGDFSVTAIDVKFGQATFSGLGSLSDDSLDFKPLLPDADAIDGTWVDQDRGTNLFAAIDEMVADDANYIQSKSDPANDICKISLSDPGGTPTQPFNVIYRYEKFGTRQIDLTVRLLEGTTQIASWTHTDISGSFVTAQQTLTGAQFSSIGNFNNLFVEFTANAP